MGAMARDRSGPVAERGRPRPRVVMVGAGFGGLNAVLGLTGSGAEITVVDRDNYHGFWPLLYQVATAGLGPGGHRPPGAGDLLRQANVTVRQGGVVELDVDRRQVDLDQGEPLGYDYLVLAAGQRRPSDFGMAGVEQHAFPLKTLPDAVQPAQPHPRRLRARRTRSAPGARRAASPSSSPAGARPGSRWPARSPS